MKLTLDYFNGRDLEIVKQGLLKHHDTLDLVLKGDEIATDQLVAYADSISYVDDKGDVVAVIKEKDGQVFDNRPKRAQVAAKGDKPELVTRLPEDQRGPNNPIPTQQATDATIPGSEVHTQR
jgi:hypothetical protein